MTFQKAHAKWQGFKVGDDVAGSAEGSGGDGDASWVHGAGLAARPSTPRRSTRDHQTLGRSLVQVPDLDLQRLRRGVCSQVEHWMGVYVLTSKSQ